MGFCNAKCTSDARLDGKTAVITGCNTGIGKITAKDFYIRGAKVIMACRNVEKAEATLESIKKECEGLTNLGNLIVVQLDLMSLQSVRSCAQQINESEPKIDLLVNNAGVMVCPKGKTEDGFEIQFGTNHLGHFLLTMLLLPKIVKSAQARIVILSSVAHNGKIDFDDLQFEKKSYDAMKAYTQSKLANILFAKELARRIKESNITGVNVYSLHPGVIQTELSRHMDETYFKGVRAMFETLGGWYLKTPEQGAQTTIYCSVDEKCANETGLYYAECAVKQPSKVARDMETANKLWVESLKLVGLPENYDPFN